MGSQARIQDVAAVCELASRAGFTDIGVVFVITHADRFDLDAFPGIAGPQEAKSVLLAFVQFLCESRGGVFPHH